MYIGDIWSPTQGVGTLLIASTMDLFHFSIASANIVCLGGWLAGVAESWFEKGTLLALASLLITTLTILFKGCLLCLFGLVLARLFYTLTISGLFERDLAVTLIVVWTCLPSGGMTVNYDKSFSKLRIVNLNETSSWLSWSAPLSALLLLFLWMRLAWFLLTRIGANV